MANSSRNAIAVLGAGSWGTALALLLARNGHTVRLWGHNPEHIKQLRQDGENRRYLPGFTFPSTLALEADIKAVTTGAEVILIVVPSHAFAKTLTHLRSHVSPTTCLVWATKGLETNSGRLLHEVTRDILGESHHYAVISGPSFAREVAAGMPTAITIAAEDIDYAQRIADLLHGSTFRAYTSEDMIGVELGGAVKNIMAIATGISDGLGFGANARAALITRGLAEMVRLGMAVGGRKETFMGLAGLGDLVLTCTDNQSRNRRFGLAIGRRQDVQTAQQDIGQVVEGANTVREVISLAGHYGVEMPITAQVHQVLYKGTDPGTAVRALLSREQKSEDF